VSQHFGITVDRGPGVEAPSDVTTRFWCDLITVTKDPATGELPMCGPPL
jgi:hypothetical protein